MGKKKILEIIESRGYVRPGEAKSDKNVLYKLYRAGVLKRSKVGLHVYYYRDSKRLVSVVIKELVNRKGDAPLYVEVEEEVPCLECIATRKYKTKRGTTIYVIPR
ncbi:hypothetical protein [Pyrobaculum sp.]|uniref:hypothetical protein n=1 Tax=Pyrobaculum sp. TaxID=2004705 RepID=UPI003D1008B9